MGQKRDEVGRGKGEGLHSEKKKNQQRWLVMIQPPLPWPVSCCFQCAPSLSLSLFLSSPSPFCPPAMALDGDIGPWTNGSARLGKRMRFRREGGKAETLFCHKDLSGGSGGFGAQSQTYKSLAPFPASSSLFFTSAHPLSTTSSFLSLSLSVDLSPLLAFSVFDHSVAFCLYCNHPSSKPCRAFESFLFFFLFILTHIHYPLHPYRQDVVHYCLSVSLS